MVNVTSPPPSVSSVINDNSIIASNIMVYGTCLIVSVLSGSWELEDFLPCSVVYIERIIIIIIIIKHIIIPMFTG